MSFPRYPAYKDSGVEWLGDVPAHWEVKPLRRLVEETNAGEVIDKTYWGSSSEILYTCALNPLECDYENFPDRKRTTSNDLLLTRNGTPYVHKPVENAIYTNVVQRIKLSRRENRDYVATALQNSANNLKGYGVSIESLNYDMWKALPLVIPPVPEQTGIAAFLDRETAKIDKLVAEQRRLMDLLKEKRQAVISHAVTKGLNPDAPMRPSGIEWLGDVPAHWGLTPLKYVVNLRSGGTPSKANLEYWNGDVPWASSKDLKAETLSDTQDHITQKAIDDDAAVLVPGGSVLIVVRGMILIHSFPVVKALVPMAINQDLKALTPSPKLNADFLAWLLRGAAGETLGRIDEAAHGTKVLRLDAWTSIVLPIPPIDEQAVIVSGIIDSLKKLDALSAKAQHAIDLLQERRTALISAAVTGQIDVRGLVELEAA